MAERTPAKSNTQKLREITDALPDFTQQYFYSGTSGKAILTRLSYALDIRYFLDFSVNFLPYFPDKKLKELSLDDIKQIKATDIDDFLTWMDENQHLSERTRARRRSSVSGLFEYLINTERKLEYNPVSGSQSVEIPENEYVIYLNLDEQEQLLNCIRYGTGLSKGQKKAELFQRSFSLMNPRNIYRITLNPGRYRARNSPRTLPSSLLLPENAYLSVRSSRCSKSM